MLLDVVDNMSTGEESTTSPEEALPKYSRGLTKALFGFG